MMVFMQINLLARLFFSQRNQLKQCPQKIQIKLFHPVYCWRTKTTCFDSFAFVFFYRSFSQSLDIVLFVCLFAVRQFRLCETSWRRVRRRKWWWRTIYFHFIRACETNRKERKPHAQHFFFDNSFGCIFFSFVDLDRVLISWDWNLNPFKGCLLY